MAAPMRVEFDRSVSATVFNPLFTGAARNTLPLGHLDVRIKNFDQIMEVLVVRKRQRKT